MISEGTTTGTDQDDRRRVSCVGVSAHQVPLNVLIDERKRKCGILRAICCFVYFTLAAPASANTAFVDRFYAYGAMGFRIIFHLCTGFIMNCVSRVSSSTAWFGYGANNGATNVRNQDTYSFSGMQLVVLIVEEHLGYGNFFRNIKTEAM